MDVIKKVAKTHGVTANEVKNEMICAINFAKENPDPKVQETWNRLFPDGKEPTPEEFIRVLVQEVRAKYNS